MNALLMKGLGALGFSNPKQAKKILIVVIVAIIIIVIVRKVKTTIDKIKAKNAAKKAAEEAKAEENIYKDLGESLTYPKSQYEIYADTLFDTFSGWNALKSSDDLKKILDVFRGMENNLDILELEKSFGVRIPIGMAVGFHLGYIHSAAR